MKSVALRSRKRYHAIAEFAGARGGGADRATFRLGAVVV
jgi:hypothetical protein